MSVVRQQQFRIVPQNLQEAVQFSELIGKSAFCPASFKGKPGDVLIAMQMGAEIGLSPMQALQNIAVINGKPCIYGDAALAVVLGHSAYVSHKEWIEGSVEKGDLTAYCSVVRKGSDEYVVSFSMSQAKKAGLWNKAGVWQQYPERMLQMRARSFALRDKFADALRGINFREEVEDYHTGKKDSHNQHKTIIDLKEKEGEIGEILFVNRNVNDDLANIKKADSLDKLQSVFTESYKHWVQLRDNESVKLIIDAKDERKKELEEMEEFIDEMNEEDVNA